MHDVESARPDSCLDGTGKSSHTKRLPCCGDTNLLNLEGVSGVSYSLIIGRASEHGHVDAQLFEFDGHAPGNAFDAAAGCGEALDDDG